MKKRASKQKPRPGLKIKVREISNTELRKRTRRESQEFKKLLEFAQDRNMHVTCDDYRDARMLAQRLTAVRSFYGFDVKIQHRGIDIFISPRMPTVEVEEVAALPAGE